MQQDTTPANRHSIAKRTASIVCVLICLSITDPAQTSTAGQRTFETLCASCHGLNGKGGERAPDIVTKPEVARLSDNQLLKILREGTPQAGMPPFGELGMSKLSELLSYLRILQGKRSAPVTSIDAGNGKEFFNGKGGCSQCHMLRGAGGFIGPDLSDYGATHSADDICNAILNADKRPGFRKSLAKAATKDGQQISGLVRNEDNFSVQLQSLDGAFHLLEKSNLTNLTFEPAPLMPGDYASRLTKAELDQIVAYLLGVGTGKQEEQAAASK